MRRKLVRQQKRHPWLRPQQKLQRKRLQLERKQQVQRQRLELVLELVQELRSYRRRTEQQRQQ